MNAAQTSSMIASTMAREDTALRCALDCLRVAVTLFDADERLVYANRHFSYLFAPLPEPSALYGRRYHDIVRLEVETGALADTNFAGGIEAFIAARRRQMSDGDFAPRDIRLADERIVEIKMRRTDSGFIALWSDATTARAAFGRLETAVEMSADAFAYWDRADRLVLCNAAFAQIHGAEGEQGLAGEGYRALIESACARGLFAGSEDPARILSERMRAHLAPAGAITVQMADGKAFLVRDRPTPDGGRATVFTDITDRSRAEAAFAEQSAALSQAQDTLDRQNGYLAALTKRMDAAEQSVTNTKVTFLRTMSHELKTPLNAVIGFSDLLRSSPDRFSPEQVGEYADLIHRAGNNLLVMLNQILDLTKIAAGRFPLDRQAVSVRGLFDEALDMYSGRALDKSIALAVIADGGLSVQGDAGALATLTLQLVQNAVTFTQNGGRVELSAWREKDIVAIRVADDGPGIDAGLVGKLCEPFEQGCRDTASHHGGAGLGLTLVKALTELQGGRLTLASSLGEGFTATVHLPAA